jgi:hypothetical protein
MKNYYLDRMDESFKRAQQVAAEISACCCKSPAEDMTDSQLNRVYVYAQFAGELRELIDRYRPDLDELREPGRVLRVVNELINGMAQRSIMRQFRGKGEA